MPTPHRLRNEKKPTGAGWRPRVLFCCSFVVEYKVVVILVSGDDVDVQSKTHEKTLVAKLQRASMSNLAVDPDKAVKSLGFSQYR